MMKKRSRFGLGSVLLTLLLVVGSERAALSASIDFETGEGYSVGDLHGQPTTGNQWNGDITPKIAVTSAQFQSGGHSVLIDPGVATGKVSDDLDVGSVPNQFSLKFHWRPSGTSGGDAVIYLSQFGSSTTNFVGPWVQFVGGGSVYQIKYVENGFAGNIKLGMSPAVYENNWWEVEIVGDISTHSFDFYLDGTLEGSGLGFRNTLGDLATSLNYVGLQASNTGSSDHYFDNIQINVDPAAVPTLSEWGRLFLLVLLVSSTLWMRRSPLPEAGV
jgi:hypothetical protein